MASARYNGMRLPLIPDEVADWPFHTISVMADGIMALEAWSSLPSSVAQDSNGEYTLYFPEGNQRTRYLEQLPYEEGDQWMNKYTTTVTSIGVDAFRWSDVTVTAPDGTVVLQASEPIINADESFRLGIAVGMSLKGW